MIVLVLERPITRTSTKRQRARFVAFWLTFAVLGVLAVASVVDGIRIVRSGQVGMTLWFAALAPVTITAFMSFVFVSFRDRLR